jgi:hypothetical protein
MEYWERSLLLLQVVEITTWKRLKDHDSKAPLKL